VQNSILQCKIGQPFGEFIMSVKWTEHIDGIDVTMDVTATYGGLVEAETGKAISSGEEKVGVPYTGAFQEVTLNAQDSLKVFHLDANTTWEIIDHGIML
jgi:hypothetical protein